MIRLDRPVGRGVMLEVPAAALPSLDEGEYYAFELEGLRVEEEGGGELGVVTRVVPGVANDVLELNSGLALPLVEDCAGGRARRGPDRGGAGIRRNLRCRAISSGP